MAGKTTFIVAHRLIIIQRTNRILVLNNGRIVEQGDHFTLMERKGKPSYSSVLLCDHANATPVLERMCHGM